jgi:RNA polymerase sigma-70 factor (ECF subfamily)
MSSRRAVTLAEIEAAYRAHGHHVQRRARLILGNDIDAREVIQEVFLSLIDHPEQFGAKSVLSTWLYSATVHRCLNRLRDERTRTRLRKESAGTLLQPQHPPSAEHVTELRALLLRLPDELAQVAIYQFADEMSQDEIAEVMRCSRRQVRNLLSRLEQALSVQEETPR